MQNRHMAGEEIDPKFFELFKMNRGVPLLSDLCLAMRSDPLGEVRGMEEVVTCIYGQAVSLCLPDPLIADYYLLVTHINRLSVGTRWDGIKLVLLGVLESASEWHGAVLHKQGLRAD